MMNDWKGKHLVILGAARQGLALARYLSKRGTEITITDQKEEQVLSTVQERFQGNVNWVLGSHPLELLDTADGLSLSGGIPLSIPLVRTALQRGIPLTNDSQIFMELVPCLVIGITGSAGKTTTTLLVGKMVEDAYGKEQSWVGGNIGNPLIAVLDQIKSDHIAVMELSSFQLELMTKSPAIACVTNVTPNHLDRHGTMEEYIRVKTHILDFQTGTDVAVLNREDLGSWNLRSRVQGRLESFGVDRPGPEQAGSYLEGENICYWDGKSSRILLPIRSIKLRGEHNLMNVLAACAIAKVAGISEDSIKKGVEALEGIEHRLEFVRSWHGADWINDSIATAPERSIAAIHSFEEPLVLLAGGRDKDLPWGEFADLVQERVKSVILFGEAADLVEDALLLAQKEGKLGVPYIKCAGLEDAVQQAAEIIQSGEVVLLSPGGTSFDEFEDFAERGEYFRQCVQKLN
ncbi:MAG: UDP-N-acetylmuramoyl-L-alanine--D-glutamate ligase [Anaerolineales bacterium]